MKRIHSLSRKSFEVSVGSDSVWTTVFLAFPIFFIKKWGKVAQSGGKFVTLDPDREDGNIKYVYRSLSELDLEII